MAASGRHLARRNAAQALYQWDITGQDASSIKSSFIFDDRLDGRYLAYFETLIREIPGNIQQIDQEFAKYADRPIDKLDPLERAILRLGTYELLFEIDVPPNVVVNECVEIARLFCAEHGYKYVNGVLDKVSKALAPR